MPNRGWIKLYRDIEEHWVFEDPLLLKIWLTILLTANHEERKILINHETVTIHRGQFWTSIRKLSVKVNMSKNTTEKALRLFESDGMIYVDARKGIGTLISVRNYADYQDISEADSDTSWDTARDTSWDKVGTHRGTHRDHKQELKNIRMSKNGKKVYGAPGDPDYVEEV